jgi:hypothetical protein
MLILMVPFMLMSGSAMVAEERGHVVSLSAAASFERSIVLSCCARVHSDACFSCDATAPGNGGFDTLVSELDHCGIVLPSCVNMCEC